MSADQETDSKLSADTIKEATLDLSPGITDDDKLLWRKDKNAVDFSLNYAKLWCKFCKELVTALEKKATLENELCRSWAKQFQSFESTVSSSTMFGAPMRTESLMMSKLIIDHCKDVESQNSKKLGKLLDVISRQRTEFSKTRKHYKEKWKSDCKKMLDAENTMLKTKGAYYQRCQQGVKLREELTNAQALLTYMQDHGIQESAGTGNVSMTIITSSQSSNPNLSEGIGSGNISTAISNPTQNDSISASQMSKQKLKVDKLEKQLADNDKKEIEQMYLYKESVETANNRLIEFEKKKMEHLCDIRLTTSRSDEIVKDTIAEYLRILTETRTTMMNEYATLSNKFQEYKPCQEYRCLIEKQMSNKPDVYSEKFQVELYHDCASSKDRSESQVSRGFPRLAIGGGKDADHDSNRNRPMLPSHSDSDSDNENMSTSDGVSTPGTNRTGVLNTIVEFGSNLFRQGGAGSINPTNETTRRNQTVKNKKSTSGSTSSMTGSAEGLGEKDLDWQKEVDGVIEIILKCIEIIELNGLSTHGIYRVSASKLKVGLVMESLNNQGIDSDLINEQPITLANVVKSKLISLSEPLVPYNLYNEFVDLGKEAEIGELVDSINRLKSLIVQLPPPNKKLAGLVFHHLKKIANNSDENQMNSVNLGTLFAPTLIKAKPRFRMADIKEYMDNKSQAKIVQIIIENVEELFGPAEQYYSRITKEDHIEVEKIKPPEEKEVMEISKSSYESTVINKTQRPHSSIIDTTVSLSISSETCFTRPLSGSLRVPLASQSVATASISNQPDKPAPKMMDMLFGMDIPATIRSTSPRAKKISNDSSLDKDQPVQDNSSSDKNSSGLPHRSISVGSGPLPESIKLAQLSKPSNDSIFSKSKDIENEIVTETSTTSHCNTSARYNDLKRSFISSTESHALSKANPHSSSLLTDESIKSTNLLLNRSRPTSATTRSSYNYSSNIDPPPGHGDQERPENSALQTHFSSDPIFDTSFFILSSFNVDNDSFIAEDAPEISSRIRSKSIAVTNQSHNNDDVLIRKSSMSCSPFERQSKYRAHLSAKSLSDLRLSNLPDHNIVKSQSYPIKRFDGMNNAIVKVRSVDHIDTMNDSRIPNYQSWLIEPVFDEFYV